VAKRRQRSSLKLHADTPFLESVNYCGIDAIVLKPISEEQLVKTVWETLNGLRHGSAGVMAGSAA
jgi:DNA-binding NarL/FixJ family response regulator